MTTHMSKKRKFVADGVFFAELNEVLMRKLTEDGYSGVEVRVTPMRTVHRTVNLVVLLSGCSTAMAIGSVSQTGWVSL